MDQNLLPDEDVPAGQPEPHPDPPDPPGPPELPDPPEPLPNPPEGGIPLDAFDALRAPADTIDDLMSDLNRWGKLHGLHFIRAQASNKDKAGNPRRFEVHCDRGRATAKRGAGIRNTSTKRIECPWRGVANALKANDFSWTFRLSNKQEERVHNHGPSLDPSAHQGNRGFTEEQKGFIRIAASHPGVGARQIGSQLEAKWPDLLFKVKDINNELQYQRTAE
ncbi:hypothetical protein QBC33DRAFT_445249, partial [Phialemonium atrogriseum]